MPKRQTNKHRHRFIVNVKAAAVAPDTDLWSEIEGLLVRLVAGAAMLDDERGSTASDARSRTKMPKADRGRNPIRKTKQRSSAVQAGVSSNPTP